MRNKMKAMVIYEPGGPEKFVLEERAIPSVKERWTLVKIKGFGINHSEIFTRKGLSLTVQFPRILGIECVGQVVETTRRDLQEGQKIVSIMGEMGRAYDGSYAEYVLLPNEQIYPVDSQLSWEELAAVPETYYTAFGSFKNMQIKEGDSILVRAATSGVGLAFLKLVKAQFPQNRVVGAVRSLAKKDLLQQQGFDEIILDERGVLQTEEKFDKILELVGSATLKNSFDHIQSAGIICNTGQLGGKWYVEEFDPIVEIRNNSYLTSFYSGNVHQQLIDELFSYIDAYKINVSPQRIFSLEQIPAAHSYIESQAGFGKVVVLNN
ncbi:zinc-binding dehydrogenase [Streptococcus sp. NSJ-72]|uniref:zinc-binding dehydrogenase n=1 Tax=Streptococcus sp. NSJ-72 TaxID=2763068 RepID=UPI001C9E4D37|nr:zinc-binding dehydrogenase [Streptococcus sp. NSJ-72]